MTKKYECLNTRHNRNKSQIPKNFGLLIINIWTSWSRSCQKRLRHLTETLAALWFFSFGPLVSEDFASFSYAFLLTFNSMDEILKCADHSNESYWAVLSCGNVYYAVQAKVVLAFDAVDEILKCDHSNESYWAVLSCGTVYCAVPLILHLRMKS